jgi:type II secretory pathway component PulF
LLAVPLPTLAMMYRQFATLMDAGVPIAQACATLAQQTNHPRLQSILRAMSDNVNAGGNLSQVMERYPSTFTAIQTELIRAGETSGMLDLMANRIADYLEKEIETRRKLRRETLYPKIVLSVAGMVILLLTFLRSGLSGFFGMVTFAVLLAGAIFGVWWLARFLNQFPAFGAGWDHVKMLMPGVGGVVRRYATARFARALGALYGGGVLLPRAVETAAAPAATAPSASVCSLPRPPSTWARAFRRAGALGLLSPMAVQMARTGEQTGSLDTMMEKSPIIWKARRTQVAPIGCVRRRRHAVPCRHRRAVHRAVVLRRHVRQHDERGRIAAFSGFRGRFRAQ